MLVGEADSMLAEAPAPVPVVMWITPPTFIGLAALPTSGEPETRANAFEPLPPVNDTLPPTVML